MQHGVDLLRCAVHNAPVLYSLGKVTCAYWTEHTDLDTKWVSKSRTRELLLNADSESCPMYIEGDNGLIFKHRLAGWWTPPDPEQHDLYRRIRSTRARLGVEPFKFVHLITHMMPSGRAVFDTYGPTLADAGSALTPRGRPVKFGIDDTLRVGRPGMRDRSLTWVWVEQYREEDVPSQAVQKARVELFWAEAQAETARLGYVRVWDRERGDDAATV